MSSGFLSQAYAASLTGIGTPMHLAQAGGWLLRRPIPGSPRIDGMGVYPYLCCERWDALADDMASLRDSGALVSAVTATDPFGAPDADMLGAAFDFVRPFKQHFVIDTAQPMQSHVRPSHRSSAARALRKLHVEVVADPMSQADELERLYTYLCARHNIAGVRAFSPQALRAQLQAPGLVMFRAVAQGRTVGLDLWYVQGDCAHGHLAAFDDEGYRLRASYATKMFLIEWFRSRLRWINLGGEVEPGGGLGEFKSGWATGTRPSWLCGRVFDQDAYQRLTQAKVGADSPEFFPAYRAGDRF